MERMGVNMADSEFVSELQTARSLYVDAYRQLHSTESPVVPSEQWDDIAWLDAETEKLVVEWVMKDSMS
jgi:hypothetical protein